MAEKIERRDIARAILKYQIGDDGYEFTYPELRRDFSAEPHTAPARRLRNLLDSMEEEGLIEVGKKGRSRNRLYEVKDIERIKALAGVTDKPRVLREDVFAMPELEEVDESLPLAQRLEKRQERLEKLLEQLIQLWS